MVNVKRPIVFFGTEAWGVPGLEALVAAGYDIAAVVTRPDAPAGRKRVMQPTPIKTAALAHGLTVWEPDKVGEIVDQLTALKPALGVLIAYGKLIPQTILDLFPLGIVNLHPSALPKYRGPSPIETAILDGVDPGDISLIMLDASMDGGDIVASRHVELGDVARLTAPEVYERLGEAAAPLLTESVASVLAGEAKLTSQNEAEASLSRILTKADGELDLTQSAMQLERQIRAFAGWPGSHTTLLNTKVTLTAGHVEDTVSSEHSDPSNIGTPLRTETGELAVTTARGLLIIDRLIPAGKREMTGREFLAGHPLD